jgi:hypothetical protein
MGRKENQKKLEVYLFKNLDLFREIPIFMDGTMTHYTVTIDGNVISYAGYSTDKPRKIKPIKMPNGYYKVNINVNGKEKLVSLHRLVAEAFVPNPENKPEVNHINGDKALNAAYNLEWNTSKENITHAYRTGLKTGMKGESHPLHKINANTVNDICLLLSTGDYSYKQISEMTGASYTMIKKIKNKERWKDITSRYDFSNYDIKQRKKEMRCCL